MKYTLPNIIRYPTGNVLLRNLARDYPIISHGEGLYLYDKTGKRYLDAAGGALVVSAGHGNRQVTERIAEQLNKVAYVNGTQFTSESAEILAQRLAQRAKNLGLNRAFFLCSGSEAIEAAIKFVRQLWIERGEPVRHKLIARAPSYHGNTLYALSASGRPHYKKYYGPLLHEVVTIPAPFRSRSCVENYEEQAGAHYAQYLEDAIIKEGPDTIGAFIVEPIIGSSAGGAVPPADYFKIVQQICRKYGVLIIADEVLCGSGRTGSFLASEQCGLEPDVIVLGKSLGSGYVPLSAVLVKDEHVREMENGTGYFMHAQTYLQAPCMAAAGVAVLEFFEQQNCIENCAKQGLLLHELLSKEILNLPCIGSVDGKGLLAGIEFVEDKKTRKPFDRSRKIAEDFTAHCFKNGLVLWPNAGHVDGVNGDLVMLGPPFVVDNSAVDEIVASLKQNIVSYFTNT